MTGIIQILLLAKLKMAFLTNRGLTRTAFIIAYSCFEQEGLIWADPLCEEANLMGLDGNDTLHIRNGLDLATVSIIFG